MSQAQSYPVVSPSVSPAQVQAAYDCIARSPIPSREYAESMDEVDPLSRFRFQFAIPPPASEHSGRLQSIYLQTWGLGLLPIRTTSKLQQACAEWARLGARSYTEGKFPLHFNERRATKLMQPLLGAADLSELCLMNSLSVNINLLMISFYNPTQQRYKILIENVAFCSDHHIIQGQLKLHNISISDGLIECQASAPNKNKFYISNEDIIAAIHKHKDEIALVWLGCTQYLTGQLWDIARICKVAHQYGIYVGLDLAHGVGNVALKLHEWNVDCAAWCSYKYLSGGGNGMGGIFVHQRHHRNTQLRKLQGWWGQKYSDSVKFISKFEPAVGAKSWAMSQAPMLQAVALEAALEIFEEANFENLLVKSKRLTRYLQVLIFKYLSERDVRIVTPLNENERGCQLSLEIVDRVHWEKLKQYLRDNGVICDISGNYGICRVAPTPLYNTFMECWDFVKILQRYFNEHRAKLSKL